MRILSGRPYPMGATWDGEGVNFALFSLHATRVELCRFDDTGRREIERIDLPDFTDEVWHGYLPDARPGMVYGYRVHGPYQPEAGHRFNHHKLVLDPYARALVGSLRWHDALFGYRLGQPRADLAIDRRDSAPYTVKAKVIDPAATGGDRRPATPWSELIIYETHVRGMTYRHPSVPTAERGTFAGLTHPDVVDHLLKLGVTAIELLPVHAFVQDRILVERGLANYWGYNTLAFFAPEPRYLSSGQLAEFRRFVRVMHAAGIEVILDVVFNHTAEGNHLGPTLSFRGIDNAVYYRLMPDDARYYDDMTGCGNTLNLSHPKVLQLVMDALRYWALELRVDGFRFDLASSLGREANGFDAGSGFLDAIRQDPQLAHIKLIAEPWDLGLGGYQLGGFPPGWSEWNDRFRNTARQFWKGDEGQLGDLAERIAGSADLFNHHGRRPSAGINFVTAHDGFTLADLVSYNEPHNEANQENNQDGSRDNKSFNYGTEGPTNDPELTALRQRQMRNFLATLLLSTGVPMLLGGDEMGRSQHGNNNAYCQDNEISWFDWSQLPAHEELCSFIARLNRLRRTHAALHRDKFFRGTEINGTGIKDIIWLSPVGRAMEPADWTLPYARTLGVMFGGSGPEGPPLVMLINAHDGPIDFKLPGEPAATRWARLIDTADPAFEPAPEAAGHGAGDTYPLPGRSLVLLQATSLPAAAPPPQPERHDSSR
jgi:isoamylase